MEILFQFLMAMWIISVSYGIFVEWLQGIEYRKYSKKIKDMLGK